MSRRLGGACGHAANRSIEHAQSPYVSVYDSLRRRFDRRPPIASRMCHEHRWRRFGATTMIAAARAAPVLSAALRALGLEHEDLDLEVALDIVGAHDRPHRAVQDAL